MTVRVVLLFGCLTLSSAVFTQQAPDDTVPAAGGALRIVPIAHATLQLIHGNTVILIDPALDGALPPPPAPPGAPAPPPPPPPLPGTLRTTRYRGLAIPTLILVTHGHEDHFATEALNHVKGTTTRIVAPASLKSVPGSIGLAAGAARTVDGVTVEAVPMYNLKRGPKAGAVFHQKGAGNGYVVTIGAKRVYVAGDTECAPEVRALTNIDVAFLPMNLPFTMTPLEAAECAKAFKPAIVYPYHYAGQDVREFAKAVQGTGIEVRIRNWYPVIRPPAEFVDFSPRIREALHSARSALTGSMRLAWRAGT